MTTFQAILYGALHGFTELLPLSANAHHALAAYVFGTQEPTGALLGALTGGSLLALLVYFRHDWASLISCFLQVVIYRRRPMTIDERLPMFIFVTLLPVAGTWYYLHERLAELLSLWMTPLFMAGSLAAFGIPFWLADSFSKKNKTMSDWNWIDAFVVGIGQIAMLIPGCGIQSGALIGGLLRNYNREASAKFGFFVITPVVAAIAFTHIREINFHDSAPMPELSWLSFGMAGLVTFFCSLLAIGAFMKNVQRKGFGQYVLYRCLVAIAVVIVYWFRSRTN